MICNKRTLAEVFGVSEPTITTWMRLGCPVEKRRHGTRGNEYDTCKVFAWRVARADESVVSDLSSEKAKLAKAQREKTEIEIARLNGVLIDHSKAERATKDMAWNLVHVLQPVPARVSAQLGVSPEHRQRLRDTLRAEIDECRRIVSAPYLEQKRPSKGKAAK